MSDESLKRKERDIMIARGHDASRLLNDKTFRATLSDWEKDLKETLLSSNPFDSKTHIKAKISIDNISFLLSLLENMEYNGKNAQSIILGENNEPGLL